MEMFHIMKIVTDTSLLCDHVLLQDKTENYTLTTYVGVEIPEEASYIDTTGSMSSIMVSNYV